MRVTACVCPTRLRGTVTCTPLVGRSSSSDPASSRRRTRSTHGPVAFTTTSARTVDVRPVSSSTERALVVVNATGPWVDRVRRLDDAGSELLLRPTKGVHVAVPRKRVGHTQAVTLMSPMDGRVMFVLPWGDLSYIGTRSEERRVGKE